MGVLLRLAELHKSRPVRLTKPAFIWTIQDKKLQEPNSRAASADVSRKLELLYKILMMRFDVAGR